MEGRAWIYATVWSEIIDLEEEAGKEVHTGECNNEKPRDLEYGRPKVHHSVILCCPAHQTSRLRREAPCTFITECYEVLKRFTTLHEDHSNDFVFEKLQGVEAAHSTSLMPFIRRMILRKRRILMTRRTRLLPLTGTPALPASHSWKEIEIKDENRLYKLNSEKFLKVNHFETTHFRRYKYLLDSNKITSASGLLSSQL